jgi:hypothetical protein
VDEINEAQRDLARHLNQAGKSTSDKTDLRRGFYQDPAVEPSVVQMLGQLITSVNQLTDSVREAVSSLRSNYYELC